MGQAGARSCGVSHLEGSRQPAGHWGISRFPIGSGRLLELDPPVCSHAPPQDQHVSAKEIKMLVSKCPKGHGIPECHRTSSPASLAIWGTAGIVSGSSVVTQRDGEPGPPTAPCWLSWKPVLGGLPSGWQGKSAPNAACGEHCPCTRPGAETRAPEPFGSRCALRNQRRSTLLSLEHCIYPGTSPPGWGHTCSLRTTGDSSSKGQILSVCLWFTKLLPKHRAPLLWSH